MATYQYSNWRTHQVINLTAPDPVLDASPFWTLRILSGPHTPAPPPSGGGGGGGTGGVDSAAVQALIDASLSTHIVDTTAIHGIADTASLFFTTSVITESTTAVPGRYYWVRTTLNPVTVTLPVPTANQPPIWVHKITPDTNLVTIDTADAATIDGDNSATLLTQYTGVMVVTDGTNYFVGR